MPKKNRFNAVTSMTDKVGVFLDALGKAPSFTETRGMRSTTVKSNRRDLNQRIATAEKAWIGATGQTTRTRNVDSLGDWSAIRLASALGSYSGGDDMPGAGVSSGSGGFGSGDGSARTLDTLLRLAADTNTAVRRLRTDGFPLKYR